MARMLPSVVAKASPRRSLAVASAWPDEAAQTEFLPINRKGDLFEQPPTQPTQPRIFSSHAVCQL